MYIRDLQDDDFEIALKVSFNLLLVCISCNCNC